jgi:hypothetical protein
MATRAVSIRRRALMLCIAPLAFAAHAQDGIFEGGFDSVPGNPVPGVLTFHNVASQRVDQMHNSNYRFDALFVDFNSDGCIEPFIFSHADWGATSRLWLNRCDGSGTFEYADNSEVNHNIDHDQNPLASGWVAMLDFDGDGRQDFWARHGNAMGARYRNASGAGDFVPWFSHKENACEGYCAFGDITGTGSLQVIGSDRRVEDIITRAQILPASGASAYQVVGDVTGDGWPDIVQPANGGYWRNDGGNLAWVPVPAFVGGRFMQILLTDFNNDGHLDLFYLDGEQFSASSRALLMRNDGSGGFANASAGSGLANIAASDYGNVTAGDFDNDGWQDLLVSGVGDSVRIYRNNGNLTFAPVAGDFGPASGQGPNGWESAAPRASIGDFDGDGRLDVVKTQHGSNLGLWHNITDTQGGRWMKVRVRGAGNNADGIGASVRWYRPGTSQLVAHMPVLAAEQHPQTHLHTGLGGQATVDLEVRFPNGGAVHRFANVGSNQEVIVFPNGCLIQNWQPGNGWPRTAPAGCGN